MRNIERQFKRIIKNNPEVSSLLCFVRIIKGKNYHIDSVEMWFDKLVDKQDYRRGKEKEELLGWINTI